MQSHTTSAVQSNSLIIAGALVGIPLGIVTVKSRLNEPSTIRASYSVPVKSWAPHKTCAAAVASGCLVLSALNYSGHVQIFSQPNISFANLAGAALMGCGIYLTGSRPDTVFAQLGSGIKQAPYVILGGLLGSGVLAWAGTDAYSTDVVTTSYSNSTLHSALGIPYWSLAAPLGVALYAGLKYFEDCCPEPTIFEDDLLDPAADVAATGSPSMWAMLKSKAWSPLTCGTIIGAMQAPSFLVSGVALSVSSVFMKAFGYIASLFTDPGDYLRAHMNSRINVWKMGLAAGIIGGSFLASQLSAPTSLSKKQKAKKRARLSSFGIVSSIAGGALLIIGSSLADGDAIAHGESGIAALSVKSILTTGGVLGGAFLIGQAIPQPILESSEEDISNVL